jgi:hypothetical protein
VECCSSDIYITAVTLVILYPVCFIIITVIIKVVVQQLYSEVKNVSKLHMFLYTATTHAKSIG